MLKSVRNGRRRSSPPTSTPTSSSSRNTVARKLSALSVAALLVGLTLSGCASGEKFSGITDITNALHGGSASSTASPAAQAEHDQLGADLEVAEHAAAGEHRQAAQNGSGAGARTRLAEPAYSPLPPGTAIDLSAREPVPGEYFNFQVCTVAYSFTLTDGRRIAVTASHCGKQGDHVWAGSSTEEFIYPADPIGTVIYSDLYSERTSNLDVALIELTNAPLEYDTNLTLETRVADVLDTLPEQVCKYGRVTGQTCGELTHVPELSKLNAGDATLESESARARVCAKSGDSGGPVFGNVAGQQVIVGLVSGTTRRLEQSSSCDGVTDVELSFTAATEIQQLIRDVLGEQAIVRR